MTRQDRTILVTGATGKQGGATARRLLAGGWTVRALVRDPQAAAARALAADGAETVVGDLDSPETLAAAAAGVHGVFAVPPTEYRLQERDGDLEYARGRRLVDAAAAAGAAHTVFTSIASVPEPDLPGSGDKRRIEAHLG
ncbi:MAG TPA: NmrA family NAD(P)-binding protein, partial [Glycomyces sp.]|nr:NmrA family NAD(P)-binding protein [Glycomyces sp.]